ncbi:hypothetical protein AVEN_127538-1 [Araneus ventricosus]|uniref:RNase H type-1 domain-containing protein n=1 Tax=Araneus ventricosus TaxID=182803 RepID=A0A4Y2HR16_ARAVE|nr:hypothetical protein AVEN_127538-1 [Araneus ventricosus]
MYTETERRAAQIFNEFDFEEELADGTLFEEGQTRWILEESPERTTKAVPSSLGNDGLKRRDSLSSILALQRACSRCGFVNKAKVDFLKAKHLVGLFWVKARVGNEGNDLAEQHALPTIIGEDYDIPAQ